MWSIIGLGGFVLITSGYSLIYFATAKDYKKSKMWKILQFIAGGLLCVAGTICIIYGVISTE